MEGGPFHVSVSLSGGGNLCGPVGGTALTAQRMCHNGLQAPEDNANQTLKCPSQISLLLFNSRACISLSLGPEVPVFRAEWVWCSPAAACVLRGWQTGEPRVFCFFKELFGSAGFPLCWFFCTILLHNSYLYENVIVPQHKYLRIGHWLRILGFKMFH